MEAFNEQNEILILRQIRIMNERQERRVRSHKKRAQYLTIFYMRFHALFLVALSNPPSSLSLLLQCKHWWIPVAVCLLISITYFLGFLDALVSVYRIQKELDMTYVHENLVYRRIQETRILNWNIRRDYQLLIHPDPLQLLKRKVYIAFTIGVMLAFTVIMLYAYRLLLCAHAD